MEPTGDLVIGLSVRGLDCDGCVRAVHAALLDVTGVQSVTIDRPRGRVEVRGALIPADSGRLAAAVRYFGYEAEPDRAPGGASS